MRVAIDLFIAEKDPGTMLFSTLRTARRAGTNRSGKRIYSYHCTPKRIPGISKNTQRAYPFHEATIQTRYSDPAPATYARCATAATTRCVACTRLCRPYWLEWTARYDGA